MSKLLSIVNQGKYDPWQRPNTCSGAKVRAPNHLLPDYVSTCWEVNIHAGDNSSWLTKVPSCGACTLFHGDKCLLSHLRSLSSNKEEPYRYGCETPWCKEGRATSNTTAKCRGQFFQLMLTQQPSCHYQRRSGPPNLPTTLLPHPPQQLMSSSQ
jgi:hypothetical protein